MTISVAEKEARQTRRTQMLRLRGLHRLEPSPSVDLIALGELATRLGLYTAALRAMLVDLQIPIITLSNRDYCNLVSFDKILYYLSRQGGPGFAGAATRSRARRRRRGRPSDTGVGALSNRLTAEDQAILSSELFINEWLALSRYGKLTRINKLTGSVRKRGPNQTNTEGE
jgi:hypothetical protein